MNENEAMEKICDTRLTWEERRNAMDELNRLSPGGIRELMRSGNIPVMPWPSTEEGRVLGGDALTVLSISLTGGSVLQVLENGAHEDAEKLVLAARLASAVARYDPVAAGELEPHVRRLLRDRRRAFPAVEFNHDSIGHYLQQHHLLILAAMKSSGAPGYFSILSEALRVSLERGGDVTALFNLFTAWLETGGEIQGLTDILLSVLGDPGHSWPSRCGARYAFDTLRSVAASYPDASSSMKERYAADLGRADEMLIEILRSTLEPRELKDALMEKVHRWVPQAIAPLQKEGALPVQQVPSRRVHKDWTPGTLERLSVGVSFDEVVSLLTEAKPEELDRVVTSLRLFPSFISWLPGAADRLQEPLRALISSRQEVPMKTKPLILGAMAFESFPLVFPSSEEEPAWAGEAIRDALWRASEAGWVITPVADRLRYCCRRPTQKSMGDWMVERLKDPAISAAARKGCIESLEAFSLREHVKKARGLPGVS